MTVVINPRVPTLRDTFSFYVSGRSPNLILESGDVADAVVVAGADGPKTVRRLREDGWICPVLFDGAAYDKRSGEYDPARWMWEQRSAGADRLLTPGCWISAEKESPSF